MVEPEQWAGRMQLLRVLREPNLTSCNNRAMADECISEETCERINVFMHRCIQLVVCFLSFLVLSFCFFKKMTNTRQASQIAIRKGSDQANTAKPNFPRGTVSNSYKLLLRWSFGPLVGLLPVDASTCLEVTSFGGLGIKSAKGFAMSVMCLRHGKRSGGNQYPTLWIRASRNGG